MFYQNGISISILDDQRGLGSLNLWNRIIKDLYSEASIQSRGNLVAYIVQ